MIANRRFPPSATVVALVALLAAVAAVATPAAPGCGRSPADDKPVPSPLTPKSRGPPPPQMGCSCRTARPSPAGPDPINPTTPVPSTHDQRPCPPTQRLAVRLRSTNTKITRPSMPMM